MQEHGIKRNDLQLADPAIHPPILETCPGQNRLPPTKRVYLLSKCSHGWPCVKKFDLFSYPRRNAVMLVLPGDVFPFQPVQSTGSRGNLCSRLHSNDFINNHGNWQPEMDDKILPFFSSWGPLPSNKIHQKEEEIRKILYFNVIFF